MTFDFSRLRLECLACNSINLEALWARAGPEPSRSRAEPEPEKEPETGPGRSRAGAGDGLEPGRSWAGAGSWRYSATNSCTSVLMHTTSNYQRSIVRSAMSTNVHTLAGHTKDASFFKTTTPPFSRILHSRGHFWTPKSPCLF